MDETRFKLILADIVLDDGRGIDILHEATRRKLKTCVIIMTAYPRAEADQDNFSIRAVDYIDKLLRHGELIDSIKEVLLQ